MGELKKELATLCAQVYAVKEVCSEYLQEIIRDCILWDAVSLLIETETCLQTRCLHHKQLWF